MTVQDLTQQQPQDPVLIRSAELRKTYTNHLITTREQLKELKDELYEQELVCYDTESNGTFDRFKVQIVGLSLSWNDQAAYYIPFNHLEGQQLNHWEVLQDLKGVFQNPYVEKVCHNAKFDEMLLARYGIDVQGLAHDTLVMAWLLATDSASRSLKPLVEVNLGYKMRTYEDVVEAAPKKKGVARDYNFARVSLEEALDYAADDAYWTRRLFYHFKRKLEAEKLWPAYKNVEAPFTRTIRKVEDVGVLIDKDYIEYADKRLPEIIDEVEAEIYEEAGEVFNIGSGAQLGPILYEKLEIGNNVPRTSKGQYKTDKKTLEVYAAKHKIVENVLRRKKITKTHDVFVEGLKGFIAQDGRIHPKFNGTGTATGRLSCSKPNLQQVVGGEVEDVTARNFFIPAPGCRFIVVDYGQIELRVMAHFSKDEKMIQSFLSGRDFHEETARGMYEVPEDVDVLPRQRFYAKSVNFGIGYGRGPKSVAEQIGGSLSDGKEVIRKWHENFPMIQPYKKHVWKECRKVGYIRTLTGRKRRLPDITSDNMALRAGAERQAFSSKIQGSAADIIKIAMIALEPRLDQFNARMILQIHDELVIECPEDTCEDALPTVQATMERPFNDTNPLRLPLVADPKIVDKWGDAK